jgi:hypothetical protein
LGRLDRLGIPFLKHSLMPCVSSLKPSAAEPMSSELIGMHGENKHSVSSCPRPSRRNRAGGGLSGARAD